MNKEIVIVFHFRTKNLKALGTYMYLPNKYLPVINVEDTMYAYACKSTDKFTKFSKTIKF